MRSPPTPKHQYHRVDKGKPTQSMLQSLKQSAWPIGIAAWILLMGAAGFACAVRGLAWWYQLLVAICVLVGVGGLFATNQLDPGALRPCLEKDPIIELLEDGHDDIPDRDAYVKDASGETWLRKLDRKGGYEKYCMTCNIWRSTRGHHCRVCGVCMERFDHHCEAMSNCIARRNHVPFAVFLLACQMGCGLMLGGSVWRLRVAHFPKGKLPNGETYILMVLAIIYGYHVLVLFFADLHVCAVITDVTTKDLASDPDLYSNLPCLPGRRNPRALLTAWHGVCCGPWRWRYSPLPALQQQSELLPR